MGEDGSVEGEGGTLRGFLRILVIPDEQRADRGRGKPRNIRRKTRFQNRIDSNNAVAKARGLGS